MLVIKYKRCLTKKQKWTGAIRLSDKLPRRLVSSHKGQANIWEALVMTSGAAAQYRHSKSKKWDVRTKIEIAEKFGHFGQATAGQKKIKYVKMVW